jgi:hypothetical protein
MFGAIFIGGRGEMGKVGRVEEMGRVGKGGR